ncbi:efflux RND transporter periplasmic adaptor subunit [Desulfogranum mediterraneum]|uniref:efflux RND transporter periplasmic adaptor subunit n=1 Tax=Desulfogranum mediterraneum TaxID=160661 RepID=UPI0003FCDF8F|nr:efflux RND transporter periplasmic adaptor subunit [Desulfogranum mediterraneum]
MMRRLLLLSLCTSLLLMASGCSNEADKQASQPAPERPPMPVETIIAKKQQVPIWLEFTGKTAATKRIEVQARVSGRLEKIFFKEGDIVEQGQALFAIEKTSYQAELARAKAVLQKDQASLALAIADVERYRPLVAEGLAPRATLEQYLARQGELEATILGDKAAIRDAELNLSYTEVTAPIDGRIGRKLVDIGNIVGYGQTTALTTIIADDPIYAYFNPTEEVFQVMRRYRDQDRMEARVRAPDTMAAILKRPHFSGQVDFSDNRVDPQTGTITMRALIDNPEHLLLEGTFVYTEVFVTQKRPFTIIPPEVVFDDQRGSYVYGVDDNDTVVRIDIRRGHSSRYYLTVPQGLEDNTRVIISGLAKVKEGLKVQPHDVTDTKGVLAIMRDKGMLPEME